MTTEGYVRGLAQYYSDGLERMEIWIDKKHASSLPHRGNQRVSIILIIGEKTYNAGIRSTQGYYSKFTIDELTENFFNNRNRTSSRNGILKSEAVLYFANVLSHFGVKYFQDLPPLIGDMELESSIKQIPGQSSGKSTSYFYMLGV